jgi:hypothetical protein
MLASSAGLSIWVLALYAWTSAILYLSDLFLKRNEIHDLRAPACKNRESQVKWKYSNFFLLHQINPISLPTMEKILKTCYDFFFVRFLQNSDFAVNELIFMLEPADI